LLAVLPVWWAQVGKIANTRDKSMRKLRIFVTPIKSRRLIADLMGGGTEKRPRCRFIRLPDTHFDKSTALAYTR
jgi:hypothetical protein